MTMKTANIFGAAAIGLAGSIPAAADDMPAFVKSFKDCALSAMEEVSQASFDYKNSVSPDLLSGSVGLSGVVPTDHGSIAMSAIWVWNRAANPPELFNAEGIVETYFGIDQAYMVDLLGIPVVISHQGGGVAEAIEGQATAGLYSGNSGDPALISYVLEKSRALNDAILACGAPSVS